MTSFSLKALLQPLDVLEVKFLRLVWKKQELELDSSRALVDGSDVGKPYRDHRLDTETNNIAAGYRRLVDRN
jgi:hypothetical protein